MQLSPLFLALSFLAADPPVAQPGPPTPPAAEIILPPLSPAPKPPKPPVPPTPSAVKLPPGVYYVVQSTNHFLATASPDGLVKINRTKGPIFLYGKFVDAPDELQEREFKSPYVTIITSSGNGNCELLVWPSRATEENQIIRQPLDVNTLPIPPPPPPPPPPVPTFKSKVQDAFTVDGSPVDAAAKLALLYRTTSATTVRDPALTTGAALLTEMQRACAALIGPPTGTLAKTRNVIADELDKTLKNVSTLNPATRDTIAALFVRVADALEGVTK